MALSIYQRHPADRAHPLYGNPQETRGNPLQDKCQRVFVRMSSGTETPRSDNPSILEEIEFIEVNTRGCICHRFYKMCSIAISTLRNSWNLK